MSIRKNNVNMARAFLGRQEIAKIYAGRKLVFERQDPSPYLLSAKPTQKLLAGRDAAGNAAAFLYTLTPDVQAYGAVLNFNRSFTLRFIYASGGAYYGPVLTLPGALCVRLTAKGLILQNLVSGKKWLIPSAIFTDGENQVEIVRDTSLKSKTTGVFINGTFYELRAMTADFALPSGPGTIRRENIRQAEFYPEVKLSPGNVWPVVNTMNIGNLIPQDITPMAAYGFEVSGNNTVGEVWRSFNPALEPAYPRWQASDIGVYFVLKLPAGKHGNVWRYKVSQRYDSGYSSRRCTTWRLEGSLDGVAYELIHEIIRDPWASSAQNLELTFEPKNRTDYKYLKFTMVSNEQNGSYCSIGQLRFWTEDPAGAEEVIIGE